MDRRYRYILFDLDGTLTDSAEGILNCAEYALRRLGREVPARESLRPMLGPPLTVTFRELFGLGEEEAELGIKYYRERYSTIGLFENRPYDGAEQLLRELRAAGYRLAVATSKPEVFSKRILERFGLEGYFDTVTGCGLDGTLDTKAEVIEETLRRLGVADRSEAVMVGDRRFDVLGAREAGLGCIGAGWGFAEAGELEESGALCIAETPEALGKMLTGEG